LSAPARKRELWWSLIQKRAFVLVTVYSDADRTGLFEIRDLPSVTQVDVVLGAFDAVVTVEGDDEKAIQTAVASISKTRGVKEAKPLIEVQASSLVDLKPVIGAAPTPTRRGRPSSTS
jgi:hypothetical protein